MLGTKNAFGWCMQQWGTRHEGVADLAETEQPFQNPHYDMTPQLLEMKYSEVLQERQRRGDNVPKLGPNDSVGIINFWTPLHDKNTGSKVTWAPNNLLASSPDEKKTVLRVGPLQVKKPVRISYSKDTVWITHDDEDATMFRPMAFWAAHSQYKVAPHAAYEVDKTAAGYKPRSSVEIRLLAIERDHGHSQTE